MEKGLLHVFVFLNVLFIDHMPLQSFASVAPRQPPRRIVVTPNDRSDSDIQQVHISLAGKDYMRVSWVTYDENMPSIVEYGKFSRKYKAMAMGKQTSYQFFSYASGQIHHVTIGPLDPDTVYFYRCGGSGPELTFKTPPSTFPVEFVVVGDLGQTEWTVSTLEHIGASDYDVLLLPGDLSYANGHQHLWDSFGRLIEPLASKRPWMVTQGNHEIESHSNNDPNQFKAYNARWLMPFLESGSQSNLYYSFDVAGAHIVMLGSYAEFEAGSDQYRWLQADLAGVDRVKTPWLLVLLHAPWYNSNAAHQGEGEEMRRAMEELLYNSRVDMVFAGHVHAYERFTRVFDNQADRCGPVYVTIGDGGNREGLALTFEEPSPSISLFQEASFGHGRLTLLNSSHAHWSWHRNDDSASVVADDIWVETLSASSGCIDFSGSSQSPDHDEL